MTEYVLAGGTVADGSGSLPYLADVIIGDGRIRAITPVPAGAAVPAAPGATIVDATGLTVCPGFVDIHTHSDLTLLSSPFAHSKVRQGVTTEVVGNCGLGVTPSPPGTDLQAIRAANSYLDLDPSIAVSWHTIDGYLAAVEERRPAVNVATLTGHLPLRIGVVGFAGRAASAAEISQMRELLTDSLAAGSLGLSTGLVYAPACYADMAELVGLAETVAAHDRVFAWHVRDYADDLLPSVSQALDVARATGCRTQISHLTALGRRNWGNVARALELIDAARDEGCRVTVDIYPYLHGNAPLSQLLPSWAQEGGTAEMGKRLTDPAVRERIRGEWVGLPVTWDEVVISWVPAGHPAGAIVGRDVASVAAERDVAGDDVALDLLAELGTAVMIVAGGRSENDLVAALEHPATVVASDGLSLDPAGPTGSGSPHPRSYGCFPRYLARYARTGDAGFADALRRCTSAPAQAAGLTGRGLLRTGAAADVVVLDRGALMDCASLTQPHQFPVGVALVMVNGTVVVDGNGHTGRRPGQVIRA
jgi:N-acyl-D-aspartate/D-glutamate deacylase